ncbi:MAG: tRNA 2-thiocytidine biosynthesis protein TtcA, partial [Solobacterium sp.]|nr:tRNA 2-thiocytidine biosynthesis protein TtcA [Solobacterium sp.]
KELWAPFLNAITTYELIQPGDRIAVCISGGKDSMCMAKLFQELERRTNIPFETVYLVMDPGYNEENRIRIEENAKLLEIPIRVFETNIFRVANHADRHPCYLCARMRRGHLYNMAKSLNCNKIALGHHLNDAIETALVSMMYASKLETLIPKVHSTNFEGMELIRPMYCIKEEAIQAWCRYNDLQFIQCACRFTENAAEGHISSKRKEVKDLIAALKKDNPEIEGNIFRSLHAVQLNTFPGYKRDGELHSFLETYDDHTDPE